MCLEVEYGTMSLDKTDEANRDMKTVQVILIIAAPGDLQAGLQLLLTRLRDVEILAVADEKSALGTAERHSPSLVILDSDISGEQSPLLVRQIKNYQPDIRCLVLLNDAEERQEALSGGADAVIIKGYPAARLAAVVEELLATGSAN